MKLKKQIINWLGNWLTTHEEYPDVPLCNFERIRFELKPGDVILVEGRSRVAKIIKLMTQSSWSHAALYIGKLHDIEDNRTRQTIQRHYSGPKNAALIIESELGEGTTVKEVTYYERDHLRICRPTGLSHRDGQQVIKYAASRLGGDYDLRLIIDMMRFFLPYNFLPRRWGSSLFNYLPGQATRTVCSCMVAEAFSFIHFPILPLVKQANNNETQLYQRNPKLCTPRDFDYSPYFQIIKYPFLDITHHEDCRLLPWQQNKSENLSNEEAAIYMTRDEIKNYKRLKYSKIKKNTSHSNNNVSQKESNLSDPSKIDDAIVPNKNKNN